jgi:hypothetical protein
MSHITTVKTEVSDEAAIILAAKTMGYEIERNATPRFYYTSLVGYGIADVIVARESQSCDLVMKLPGRYDLGFKKNAQGTYDFVCDGELLSGAYGRASQGRAIVGENGETFLNEYAAAVSTLWAQDQGYIVDRYVGADGSIELMLTN